MASKLEDQAAIAALYVTKYDGQNKDGQAFLDGNQRLSSAGQAAYLKYANPQDLPSYPSSGLRKNDLSAAGAAASLGWANQKTFEHWKPDPSSSASAAAMIAKDYKMAPLWQPEQSANGAKAALLAHKDGGKVDIWRPEAESAWGNSAASQAFKKFGAGGLSPVLDYGYTNLGRQDSVLAASGAVTQSRKRAESTPIIAQRPPTYPDEANAVANARSAASSATTAHKQKRADLYSEGGSTPFTTMSRDMYTSHPPVAPEVEEKNRQDTLHASAIAMAKAMYTIQQKQIDASAQQGAAAAHVRQPSTSTVDEEVTGMRFDNLQDAAHKLAQERLAKLHDEHSQARAYRDYYGSKSGQQQSRLSIRGRARRRASSDGIMDEDKEQSNKIRAQMSIFSNNLEQVDEKKRKEDREALIAAAQRNVTKSLRTMDERIFADTGKIAPSLLSDWELKAHASAQAKSETRMENHGKVNIGGGKFIDQSEIDAIAAKNVQPVLDEINEKAAVERERQATLKLEQDEIARKASEKKIREKEAKDINKKLKQQDKEEEKMRKAEEKQAAKEKQKSVGVVAAGSERKKSFTSRITSAVKPTAQKNEAEETAPEETAAEAPAEAELDSDEVTPEEHAVEDPAAEKDTEDEPEEPSSTIAERREIADAPAAIRTSMEDQASLRMEENAKAAAKEDAASPVSPSSPGKGRVKSWLKTTFSRRMSKGSKTTGSEAGAEAGSDAGNSKAFVGGAALTGASAHGSTATLGEDSTKEVALAGKSKDVEPATEPEPESAHEEKITKIIPDRERVGRSLSRDSEVSAVSSIEGPADEEEFQEARDDFNEALAPPPTFPAAKTSSPAREAKFHEVID